MLVRSTIYMGQSVGHSRALMSRRRVEDMRMSRWMCGHIMRDEIRNDYIRNKVRVDPIKDKTREVRLR